FFSSRRRHTRFSRDWSSDVCSSDLPLVVLDHELGVERGEMSAHERAPKNSTVRATPSTSASTSASVVWTEKDARVVPWSPKRRRSEERRVGKECSKRRRTIEK